MLSLLEIETISSETRKIDIVVAFFLRFWTLDTQKEEKAKGIPIAGSHHSFPLEGILCVCGGVTVQWNGGIVLISPFMSSFLSFRKFCDGAAGFNCGRALV